MGTRGDLRLWGSLAMLRLMLRALVLAACATGLALVGGGCFADGPAGESTGVELEWVDLVDHLAWVAVEEAVDDPFAEMGRPETIACEMYFGWTPALFLDGRALDIDLAYCDWLALEQPLNQALPAGTTMQVLMYHYDLTAPEAAESYMAVAMDGEVVWENTVVIPGGSEAGPAEVYAVEFELPMDVEEGEQVVVHVHNHGQNSYVFTQLRALVAVP